jgi:Oxidoreductase NAD-binding domain
MCNCRRLIALCSSCSRLQLLSECCVRVQVMKQILADPQDSTELRLLYANQSVDDILIRDEMEALAKQHPDRCQRHCLA